MSSTENYFNTIVNNLKVRKGKSSITKKKTIKDLGLIIITIIIIMVYYKSQTTSLQHPKVNYILHCVYKNTVKGLQILILGLGLYNYAKNTYCMYVKWI